MNFLYWLKSIFSFSEWQKLGGVSRSNLWPKVRAEYLKRNPMCAVCGSKGKLFKANECHHCIPFNKDKSKELDYNNFITLCRKDHLLFGHLNSFFSFNENVRINADEWNKKIINRP